MPENHTPLATSIGSNQLTDLAEFKFIDYQVGANESKSFENPADKLYRVLNFKPSVIYKSSHLSLLTELLSQNDYLFISPSLMMSSPDFADKFVSVFELEIPQENLYEVVLLEGPNVEHNAADQWIKEQLIKSINFN